MINLNSFETVQLLDKINENILIADEQFKIVFINQSSKQLLTKLEANVNEKKGFSTLCRTAK